MTGHPIQHWEPGAVPTGPPEEEWGKYSSVLSYSGATHRMTTWAERNIEESPGKQSWNGFVWTAAIAGMLSLYVVATAWYLFLAMNAVFALMSFLVSVFIWPLIPFSMMWLMFSLAPFGFRSHRRTQRQQTAMMSEQLKAMQAIQENTSHPKDEGK